MYLEGTRGMGVHRGWGYIGEGGNSYRKWSHRVKDVNYLDVTV